MKLYTSRCFMGRRGLYDKGRYTKSKGDKNGKRYTREKEREKISKCRGKTTADSF